MKNYVGLLALFIVIVAVVAGSRLLRLQDPQAVYAPQKTSIYLNNPVDLNELSTLLVDSAKVVKNKEQLIWAAQLLGWNSFKPGHYFAEGGYTYNQFLSKLAKGAQDPVSIKILPGQTEDKIIATLTEGFQFDSAAIYSVITDSVYLTANNITRKTLIGHLYPQSYKFYWTASPKEVLNKIFDEFYKNAIEPYKSRFQELDKGVNEILTLASIVEWEAGGDDEKPKISGLYWNRLERGMLLQADPTVNYALGKRERLYFDDYEIEDPYNTYIHPGLPPGPITNPDLSSIKAALFPAEHEFLFMVAQPNGKHGFSETYAQHQQKAAEWRRWLEEQN